MNSPSSETQDRRKERIDYAKLCFDRFVEVCKARIAIGTTLALAIVTLTGIGLHTKRYELLLIAAILPMGLLLLVDTLLKSRYAAPFLFIGLAIEHELFGNDSAAMLFARFKPEHRAEYLQALANPDRQAGYTAFRRRYAYRGLKTKLPILLLVSVSEMALAYVVV